MNVHTSDADTIFERYTYEWAVARAFLLALELDCRVMVRKTHGGWEAVIRPEYGNGTPRVYFVDGKRSAG